ncbi:MAG TPA: protein TolR [Desulfohalobiaceae bacterium]|nr:protein TolR [Desulfohalobiaceae bacterium]
MRFDPNRNGFIAQINVTPFVDVMLVLLIIFMITAPLLTQGVEVNLPQTKTVTTLPEDSEQLVLTIKEDKTLLLDEYKLKRQELDKYLTKLKKRKDQLIYLRADKKVPYGYVVKVMGDIKKAGIQRIGVVAEMEEE